MPFTSEEMKEVQEAIDEAYSFIALPFVVRKINRATTAVDVLYGESKNKNYVDTSLMGSVVENPEEKVLKKFGLDLDVSLSISVTRTELLNKSVMIDPADTIRYEGRDYRIVKLVEDGELPVTDGATLSSDFLTLLIFASTK